MRREPLVFRDFHCIQIPKHIADFALLFIIVLFAAGSAIAAPAGGAGAPAPSLVTVLPDRAPYTSETQGQLLVTPSDQFKGKSLSVDVLYGDKQLAKSFKVEAGVRASIPLQMDALALGDNAITCRLQCDGQELTTTTANVVKLAPKPNEVKIDHVTNSLIVDGRPFLPVGFYCDDNFGTLAEEESLYGFNMISPYWSRRTARTPEDMAKVKDLMDRCASVGVKVNYHLEAACVNLKGQALEDVIKPEIEAFRDHPALLAWYIADEPEYHNVTSDQLQAVYQLVKKLDPYHPICVCIADLKYMPRFTPSMDFIMSDAYPIPHQPVTRVAYSMDRARQGTNNAMPVWDIPQVFGGGEFWFREPTSKEVRVMTYLSLIHGATGIENFVRRPPLGNPNSIVLWNECRNLAMELSQLAPAILSHEPNPKVTSDQQTVQARAFLDRGMLYVLAANTVNQPATMQLKIDGGYTGKANAIFERRDIDVSGGVIKDMIDGMSTRIYTIPVLPIAKEELQPNRDNIVFNYSFEEIVSPGCVSNCYGSRNGCPYANVVLDPFESMHGRYSARMTVPGDNQSIGLIPTLKKTPYTELVELSGRIPTYWYAYKVGDKMTISFWAKGKEPGLVARLSDGCLDGFPKEFTLTQDWQRYEVKTTVTKKRPYPGFALLLMSKGTAWFDMLECTVIPAPPTPPAPPVGQNTKPAEPQVPVPE